MVKMTAVEYFLCIGTTVQSKLLPLFVTEHPALKPSGLIYRAS